MTYYKYNWDKIIDIASQHAGDCTTWAELSRVVSTRLGRDLAPNTFIIGIRRELDREFPTYESYRSYATEEEGSLEPLSQELLDRLRIKGRENVYTVLELSEYFDRAPSSIMNAAQELKESNYNVHIADDRRKLSLPKNVPPTGESIPLWPWIDGNVYRFGVISDTHLANKNARLDVLETLYDMFEEEGIEIVLLAGNLVDGEFRYNRQELHVTGVEGQIVYAAENFPQRDGITTKFITADDHEGWWTKTVGFDVGRYMDSSFERLGRDDLQWIGHVEADLPLSEDNDDAVLKISHPGGGTAYAASYKAQKAVESLQGGEKPAIWILGHYHKYISFYPRNVYVLQPGCVEDQTMWLRKRHIPCHVGGCILEILMTEYGAVGEVTHSWFPFYDKGYYNDWDYRAMHLQ